MTLICVRHRISLHHAMLEVLVENRDRVQLQCRSLGAVHRFNSLDGAPDVLPECSSRIPIYMYISYARKLFKNHGPVCATSDTSEWTFALPLSIRVFGWTAVTSHSVSLPGYLHHITRAVLRTTLLVFCHSNDPPTPKYNHPTQALLNGAPSSFTRVPLLTFPLNFQPSSLTVLFPLVCLRALGPCLAILRTPERNQGHRHEASKAGRVMNPSAQSLQSWSSQ